MHSEPMPETAGEFTGWQKSDTPCQECNGEVLYQIWESSCGGFEDEKYRCTQCKRSWWVDGGDS